MSPRHITRICVACKNDVAIADQFCPTCGADTQSALVVGENHSLWQKAEQSLPVILTLAVVLLRVGFRLGQAAWFRQALSLWAKGSRSAEAAPNSLQRKTGEKKSRRFHIRSRWTIRDSQGREHQGTEEHLIDVS